MRELLEPWFRAALTRVDPAALVARALATRGPLGGATVLAIGKAAGPMLRGAEAALGDAVVARVCVAPDGAPAPPDALRAGHPRPDARSEAAAAALIAAARAARGPLVALISGGASALAAAPAPGLTLADKRDVVAALIAHGAPITEVNAVRRALSAIKGGRLAAATAGPVVTLAISDVLGDRPSDIGSGPTVPDVSSPADARLVLDRRLGPGGHAAVRAHLAVAPPSPALPPGDVEVLATRRALLLAALDEAAARGIDATGWPAPLDGAVEDVAALAVGWFGDVAAGGAIVAGGEPTVALPAVRGRGGRAQHLALLVARAIAGWDDVGFLAAGSDGIDGDGPAAGAVVDGRTWELARRAGVDPDACVARFDAHTALAAAGALVVTGPTGVNHADLVIAVRS